MFRSFRRTALLLSLGNAVAVAQPVGANPWAQVGRQGDAWLRNVAFTAGGRLDSLRIHYTTLGTPRRGSDGTVRNAVLVLHGTGGSGRGFLSPTYAGGLFGPGQPLDSSRYYIVLPDGIGHGGSSKPSDGMRMRFPRYGYRDMVTAQQRLLTEALQVTHLRVIVGTSMGCMHAFTWGWMYPGFADALAPMACVPTQIAGRNRMLRTLAMDAIRQDPEWKGGEYTAPPRAGLRGAMEILWIMGTAPLLQQRQAPTRDAADSVIRAYIDGRLAATDANDFLYQFDASSDYDPSPHLATIRVPVLHINSEDDEVNPPELRMAERLDARMPQARFILLPVSERTRGHGTHSLPAIWGETLREFLGTLATP
ncbi:MAG: alpha/beta fold hydrolase [Gemmatimonadaceae bacterium]|nr:alpha/beta fold hydrolase [Gemmatimonadaceae bacterium]